MTTGYYISQKVGLLPHAPRSIEFVTTTTHASPETTRRFTAVLRLPFTDADELKALAVVDHYRQVRAGAIDANPGFYRRRIRVGLVVAGIFLPVAAAGFVLGRAGYGDVALGIMIVGLILAGFGLFLALLAALLERRKRRRARTQTLHRPPI